jgi:hypothetical protein
MPVPSPDLSVIPEGGGGQPATPQAGAPTGGLNQAAMEAELRRRGVIK